MTKYRPEMQSITEISKKSGISISTILRWINSGKLECEKVNRKKLTLINIYQFVNCVHKHYRYTMNSRAGKHWTEEDRLNPIGRSKTAIRLRKYRDNMRLNSIEHNNNKE